MNHLPEFLEKSAVRRMEEFCQRALQNPGRPRTLRFRISGLHIYLFEIRRYQNRTNEHRELPMAQLRFCPELNQWSLHHQNDDHWQLYLNVNPTLDFDKLLAAISQDSLGFFWHE